MQEHDDKKNILWSVFVFGGMACWFLVANWDDLGNSMSSISSLDNTPLSLAVPLTVRSFNVIVIQTRHAVFTLPCSRQVISRCSASI
jgi:hypothetical protein